MLYLYTLAAIFGFDLSSCSDSLHNPRLPVPHMEFSDSTMKITVSGTIHVDLILNGIRLQYCLDYNQVTYY